MSATPLSASEPVDLVGRTVSHFRVLEVIGRGGMGVVYKAEDELLRRVVALKVLTQSVVAGEENRRRFLREARTAAALTHPNIATVFEIGETDGMVFIAMELVPGKTLREVMRSEPTPLSPPRALALAIEIARALARAHEAAVVHRDLKPENVMVAGDDVKLLDFGIAKPLEDGPGRAIDLGTAPTAAMTGEGAIIGTPEYMSPEQLRSEPMSARSDVFALGVLLYEMLTGHRPFLRPSLLETALAVWKEEPPSIAELCPGVGLETIRIVERCLAKKPEARFTDAGQVLAALRALTGAAASGAMGTPLSKAEGRRRPLVVLGALAMAGCAGLYAWKASHRGRDAKPERVTPPSSVARAEHGYVERRVAAAKSGTLGEPQLSADGATAAYVADDGAYTLPSHGGPRRKIQPPVPGADLLNLVGFLPDGEILARWRADGEEAVWAARTDDGASRRVSRVRDACSVSPDGKLLLSCRDDGVSVQPLAGGTAVRLTTRRAGRYVEAFAWSPASDAVAYGSMDSARIGSIDIVSIDGRRTQHVISDPALVDNLGMVPVAWPRSDAIFTALNRGAGSVLVALPIVVAGAPGAPPHQLHQLPDAQVSDMMAVGDTVFLEKVRPDDDVFVGAFTPDMTRFAAPLARLMVDGARDVPVGWLEDGRTLFQSDREGEDALFAQAGSAAPALRLSDDGAATFSRMADGSVLAWKEGVGADAGASCALERLDHGRWAPLFAVPPRSPEATGDLVPCQSEIRCTKPGGCVEKEANEEGATWFAFDVSTGKKGARVHQSSEGARNWDLSPSGDTLAFTTPPDGAIAFVTIATGDLRRIHLIADDVPGLTVQFVAYAPDGRHLVVTGMRNAREQDIVMVTDLAGHARVVAATEGAWFHDPHLDATGLRLAVSERLYATTLWMLERAP